MLNQRDIDMMENDVRDIIKGWRAHLDIRSPLPYDMQPYWNNLMNEYSGEIAYDLYKDVVAERKDQQDKTINDFDIAEGAGNKDKGRLIFAISDLYTFIDIDCVVLYNGERWKIDLIKSRIGETLITISKFTGSDEKWADYPTTVYDMSDLSGGMNA